MMHENVKVKAPLSSKCKHRPASTSGAHQRVKLSVRQLIPKLFLFFFFLPTHPLLSKSCRYFFLKAILEMALCKENSAAFWAH